jgi:hypothetical protein
VGLNVYFCDVCGVRVTDVDLRSGHGMLHGQDVICATCLDMGHGKEWLSSRGAAVSAVAVATGRTAPSSNSAALLDHARDRAATVPDRATDEVPALSAAPLPSDFSGAAAGFAAMGTPRRRETDDADGEVSLESTDQVDPQLLTPAAADDATHKIGEDDHVAAPFVARDEGDEESSALINVSKDESPEVEEPESDLAAPPAARAKSSSSKSSSSNANNRKSAVAKTSSKITKSPSSKQNAKSSTKSATRSGRKPASGGMPMPLKISLITVPVIILIAAFAYVGPSVMSRNRAPDVKDLPAQKERIEHSFSEAKGMINDAWSTRKLADMKAANERWQQFQQEWDRFSKDAQTYSKWTEDDCGEFYQQLHAPDIGARTKLLRDEIVKQSSASH